MGAAKTLGQAMLISLILPLLGTPGHCENALQGPEALRAAADRSFNGLSAGAASRSADIEALKKQLQGPPTPQPPDMSAAEADRYNARVWDGKSQSDWYEWWYYKVVLPGTQEAFYLCYGVVNPWDLARTRPASRSYVSMGNFSAGAVVEQNFEPAEFSASQDTTFVRVRDNVATDRELKGRLPSPDGGEITWDLKVERDWAFNAMGWAMSQGWVSNIFWYPAQAGAFMSGRIDFKGKTYTLNRAPAYQDRNWGTSFPKWWTWLVSNNFKGSPGTVLAAGGGQPKIFPGTDFYQGVSIGLRHQGKEYAFRPTSGDLVKVDVRFGKWEVSARNRHGEKIELSAHAPREKFLLLKFMTPQGREFNDFEALLGRIRVKLYKDSKLIADLQTDEGGIEFGTFEKPEFEKLFSKENKLQ
ncbi:MAG: hypothetical protein HZB91_02090 [Elusimicrobia bacterium]|nr:hypothetical protein [Elusimicrobiota bacterium]